MMDENTIPDEGPYTTGTEYTAEAARMRRSIPRRAVLAGLGAAAFAFDLAEDTFDRFVERGQEVRDEFRERAGDVRRQNEGARDRFVDMYRGAVDSCLDRANLPNKTDLETISVKLNVLSRKIDDLQMQGAADVGTVMEEPASTPTSPPIVEDAT